MSAADLVDQAVADIQALGVPVTADPGVFPPLLSQHGVAALVGLPGYEILPITSAGVRVLLPVHVVGVPADPNGPRPLLDCVELLASGLGARGQLVPGTYDVTPDAQAPSYTLTLFRKD